MICKRRDSAFMPTFSAIWGWQRKREREEKRLLHSLLWENWMNVTFFFSCPSHFVIFKIWLAGSFRSGIVASHSFQCCITVSPSVSGDLLSILYWRSSTVSFPDIAPPRLFTTNTLCLIICPIHEWLQFLRCLKVIFLLLPFEKLHHSLCRHPFYF